MKTWVEDQLFPRTDRLACDLAADADVLVAENGEVFRIGDFVRIGEDEIYDTGDVDEDGEPIFAVWNEVVRVTDKIGNRLKVARGQGVISARAAEVDAFLIIL